LPRIEIEKMKNVQRIPFYFLLITNILTGCALGIKKPSEKQVDVTGSPEIVKEIISTSTPSPTLAPTNTPESVNTQISDIDGMEMVFVPAGEFIMGCEGTNCTVDVWPGPFPDNLVHEVYLDDYWIDKHPVTIRQYNQCVEAGVCRPFNQNNIPPQGPAYFTDPEYFDYPVINVSWYYARDYCGWAGRRLPTEAEWEKAARGTEGNIYPWGNTPYTEDKGNICDRDCPSSVRGNVANPKFQDGYKGPSPVGSYPAGASPYGALDMLGNVWEWTSTASVHYPYDPNDESGGCALPQYEHGFPLCPV
jgi:formylglycine-generating enzyme required for sulfatase activity